MLYKTKIIILSCLLFFFLLSTIVLEYLLYKKYTTFNQYTEVEITNPITIETTYLKKGNENYV